LIIRGKDITPDDAEALLKFVTEYEMLMNEIKDIDELINSLGPGAGSVDIGRTRLSDICGLLEGVRNFLRIHKTRILQERGGLTVVIAGVDSGEDENKRVFEHI